MKDVQSHFSLFLQKLTKRSGTLSRWCWKESNHFYSSLVGNHSYTSVSKLKKSTESLSYIVERGLQKNVQNCGLLCFSLMHQNLISQSDFVLKLQEKTLQFTGLHLNNISNKILAIKRLIAAQIHVETLSWCVLDIVPFFLVCSSHFTLTAAVQLVSHDLY